MATPINPQDNLNKPNVTASENANKNLAMLAYLYDHTSHDLYQALSSQKILLTDEKIKDRVKWLGEIAKTLSLVYQVESMRAKPKDNSLGMPEEKAVQADPAFTNSQNKSFQTESRPQNLEQFRSPGGWKPF